MKNDFPINERIKSQKIQLILDGANQGIVNKFDALSKARELQLDLVQVGQGETPVCKIMDFGKYKYEQNKKERHNKQKPVERKEIRMRTATEENDYNIKLKKIVDFLKEGCHVKTTIKLSGREKHFRNLGVDRLKEICEKVKEIASAGTIENSDKFISVYLTPLKKG